MPLDVLIADDDAITRLILETLLARKGHRFQSYSDGKSALDALKRPGSPPIAILDWMMPRFTGLDICEQLKDTDSRHDKYIIILSVKDSKEEVAKGFQSGADDYMTKPIDFIELEARLMAAERTIIQGRELRKYTQDLENLARRHNLLGELSSKQTMTNGETVEAPPDVEKEGLSSKAAELNAVLIFEKIVQATLNGLGLPTSKPPTSACLEPRKPGQPVFMTWVPIVIKEKDLWLDIVLEMKASTAHSLAANILGDSRPSLQDIQDILAEITNMIQGSVKAHLEKENLSGYAPFIPHARQIDDPKTLRNGQGRHKKVTIAFDNVALDIYILEWEVAMIQKPLNNLRPMDLVGDVVLSSYNEEMVLLNKWVVLNDQYIKRIKEWGISNLIADTIPIIEPSQFARNAKIVMA